MPSSGSRLLHRRSRDFPGAGLRPFLAAIAVAAVMGATPGASGAIAVTEPAPGRKADFAADIAPFLSDNCVSCHSKTTHKGGLNLENPEAILKGGDSGPAAVPGKGSESLILKVSTHEDPDSAMPPRDNKVKARNLTPAQLGLLKRWIDQGAKGSAAVSTVLNWKALPAHLRSILSVAVSADGELAACAKANQILIYRLPTAQLLFRTEAHRDQVQSLAFSPDGSQLVSGGYREMKVWVRNREKPVQIAEVPAGLSALSTDGEWLASVTASGVTMGPVATPQSTQDVPGISGAIQSIAWSGEGLRAAFLTAEQRVFVWDRTESKVTATLVLPAPDSLLAWGDDGKTLWTAGADDLVRGWDVATARSVREIKWHTARVTALCIRGGHLLTGTVDGTACLGAPGGAEPVLRIKVPAQVVALDVTMDGTRIVVAGGDHFSRVYDAKGTQLWSARGDLESERQHEEAQRQLELEEVSVNHWKERVAEADKALQSARDRLKKSASLVPIRVKELEARQKAEEAATLKLQQATAELAKLEGSPATPAPETAAQTVAGPAATPAPEALKKAQAALEAAQKGVAAAAEETQKALKAREAAEQETAASTEDEAKMSAEATACKQSLDAQEKLKVQKTTLAAAAKKQWDSAPAISAVRWVESMRALMVGHHTGRVQFLGMESGLPWTAIGGPAEGGHPALTLGVLGSKVTANFKNGRVWRWTMEEDWKLSLAIGNGREPQPFQDRVLALAFSPDGTRLAAGGGDPSRDGDILIFNPRDWKAAPGRADGIHSDTVLALAFSPDGRQLVSGAADKTARLIDPQAMKTVRTFEGHTHHVLGVAWSPDGRTILTAGADNTVKIWDVAAGTRKKSIDGVEKEVTGVQFLGGGAQFVSASGDGKLRLISLAGAVTKALPDAMTFVQSFAIAARGGVMVTGGEDGWLRIWNAKLGVKIAEMEAGR